MTSVSSSPIVGQEVPDYCGTAAATNPRFTGILVAIILEKIYL